MSFWNNLKNLKKGFDNIVNSIKNIFTPEKKEKKKKIIGDNFQPEPDLIGDNFQPEPDFDNDLNQVKQEILEKFFWYKADKPKLNGIYEALAREHISQEDDGYYQINLDYEHKSKAKIRVSQDLKQFTLIIDDRYKYKL